MNNYQLKEREKIIEIEIERLKEFKNHPFQVNDDEDMTELRNSIREYGIINPLVVRPVVDGFYEIISGHRRKHAAEQLGYRKVPVVIRVYKDEEAVIAMVDSNLQRDKISPSEKAFALKMKHQVIKAAKKKRKGQTDPERKKGENRSTLKILSIETGDSVKQIQRYLKITELIPELMEKLDKGQISFNPAYELAYLKPEEQRQVLDMIEYYDIAPSISQSQRIKTLSMENKFEKSQLECILTEVSRAEATRVSFKNGQIRKFFPKYYTVEMMKKEILEMLKERIEE